MSQLGETAAVERGAAGVGDRISALLAARAQVEALLLDEISVLDASGGHVDDGAPTTGSWLRMSGRLGRRDASGTVHHARQLRELSAPSRALRAGAISRAHAIEIIKAKERWCLDTEAFGRYEQILDVGRTCRLTNSALNKAVAQMYDACACPNCTTAVTQCEVHHLWFWSKGGGTDRWNLLPLCKHHHVFVHEYGHHILTGLESGGRAITGPGRWQFASPAGRPIPDHRKTLGRYVEQLTLMPDPTDTG